MAVKAPSGSTVQRGSTSWLPKAAALVGATAVAAVAAHHLRKRKPSSRQSAAGSTDATAAEVKARELKESQRKAAEAYRKETGAKMDARAPDVALTRAGDLGKYLAFARPYGTQLLARPDVSEGELLKVTDWYRLTPDDYDRTTFHVEVDVAGTSLERGVNGADGKALSVYATNDPKAVDAFIQRMGLDPHQMVSCSEIAPQDQDGMVVLSTLEKVLTQYLDLFGKPTRGFLTKLAPFAYDITDKVSIAELTLDRKQAEFLERQARSYTFADYITEFKSLRIPAEKYAELLPTIKQRVYSICSSSDYRPGKCQLLVVREDWQAKGGETKFGLCSSFLTLLRPGQHCVGHSTHSVMKIPDDKMVHVFMAGLGTGLAPFRAFVEQRRFFKGKGQQVGPMTLFFGGRYSKTEYYYREEFEAYEAEGLVKCCNAWSRDTATKVYVQHKIKEQEDVIWEQLGKSGSSGYFFLCGSKQPEKDVYKTLLGIMQSKGGMSAEQAQAKMEDLQMAGRYVTEVY